MERPERLGLLVEDVMSRQVVTARPETPVLELEEATRRASVHRIVITTRGAIPVGIACRCGLARARAGLPAWRVMTSPVITIAASEPVEWAVATLDARQVSSLPVVSSGGQLCGIVTRRDLRKLGIIGDRLRVCFACGATHGVRGLTDGPGFCEDCLERSRGDREFGLYGTLGGDG